MPVFAGTSSSLIIASFATAIIAGAVPRSSLVVLPGDDVFDVKPSGDGVLTDPAVFTPTTGAVSDQFARGVVH
jgi:hypothetical protein